VTPRCCRASYANASSKRQAPIVCRLAPGRHSWDHLGRIVPLHCRGVAIDSAEWGLIHPHRDRLRDALPIPGARKRIDKSAWPWVLALSILWFAFPLSMFRSRSSGLVGFDRHAERDHSAVRDHCRRGARAQDAARRILLGLATGIAGSVLIALPSFNEGKSSAFGVVLIVMACVSYGFALNVARPLQQRYGALPVIWRALGLAVLGRRHSACPRFRGRTGRWCRCCR